MAKVRGPWGQSGTVAGRAVRRESGAREEILYSSPDYMIVPRSGQKHSDVSVRFYV